ncbi:MAG TPA: hypothetical protein VI564_05505 [Candidatus Nanoarchaeia archaeon]|nr:hypothetical protein [Candidatus Nanoarchaeia archaeon]
MSGQSIDKLYVVVPLHNGSYDENEIQLIVNRSIRTRVMVSSDSLMAKYLGDFVYFQSNYLIVPVLNPYSENPTILFDERYHCHYEQNSLLASPKVEALVAKKPENGHRISLQSLMNFLF